MNPIISVILETARPGGLDWQLKLFANQTFKDFELIIIDGYYDERILDLANKYGLNLIYLKEQFPCKFGHVRPINVNQCMKHASGECFVFVDDYHMVPNNFLEEHYRIYKLGYAGMMQWRYVEYLGNIDYSEITPKFINEDNRFKEAPKYGEKYDELYLNVPFDWWWPNSTSVPAKYILAVGGFNELYSGGTGGEDNDVAYRMKMIGLKFAYDSSTIIRHISHVNIPMRPIPHRNGRHKCEYVHDKRDFTRNQYWQKGDPDLIENETLFTWHEEGYKLFQCKYCGEIGCIDGQQMLENTKNRCFQKIYVPPAGIHFPDGTYYKHTKLKEK